MAEPSPELASALAEQESAGTVEVAEGPRTFTLWERVQISFASWIGALAVLLIGRSLRWEVFGWENYEAARRMGKSLIFTCWHCEIFSATWFWRKRGIVVMASRNFDGEYITRIIETHGYQGARGSSSRGGPRALVEMIRALRRGREIGVTVDGPRGPRHTAKPGVVLLSKATGAPILCFHVAPRRAWIFRKSWDKTEIPQPFSHTAIFIAPPLVVPPDADGQEQAQKLQEVQTTLDDLTKRGRAWLG